MTTAVQTKVRYRVLLVDDDLLSLELMSLLLGHDGHQVVRALDGEAALGLLAGSDSKACPDVLLVDIQMPGVSGSELAERVRALAGPDPLLLAMSATEITANQLSAFDGFLLKPLALEDLRKALGTKKRRRLPNGDSRPVAMHTRHESLDLAVVGKLRTVMPESSLIELYAACIGDSRARATAMMTFRRKDELRRGAHQIKGAASMVGATRIARLASRLELESCTEEDTLALVHDLLSACDELERMLLAGEIQKPNEHNNL